MKTHIDAQSKNLGEARANLKIIYGNNVIFFTFSLSSGSNWRAYVDERDLELTVDIRRHFEILTGVKGHSYEDFADIDHKDRVLASLLELRRVLKSRNPRHETHALSGFTASQRKKLGYHAGNVDKP